MLSVSSSFNFGHIILLQKVATEKEALVAVKASEADATLDPPLDSHPTPNTIHRDERRSIEDKEAVDISLQGSEVTDSQNITLQDAPYDPDKIRQEKAATKAQAVFRGYLVIFSFVDVFWDTHVTFLDVILSLSTEHTIENIYFRPFAILCFFIVKLYF